MMKLESSVWNVNTGHWFPLKADNVDDAQKELMAMGATYEEAKIRQVGTENILDCSKSMPFGRNGGVVCDTLTGPCTCGAWH